MKTFLIILGLTVASLATLAPKTVVAQTLEQRVFYQFNPKRVNPKAVSDKRLSEVVWKDQILWVAKPKPGKPTVVYFHGSGGNLAQRAKKFPWFLNRGYGLVALGYPGSSGSKGKPSRQRIQSLATQLYRDLPKIVGPSEVILMGESLGTGVAVELALHSVAQKNKPIAVILQSPYTSLLDLVKYKRPLMYPLFANRTDLWPTERIIGRLKTPLFIMHGGKDTTVPVRMGKQLHRDAGSQNKRLVTYPGAGHGTIWRTETRKKLAQWLAQIPGAT